MNPDSITLAITLLLIFTAAIAGGLLAKKLRFPLIIGYIAAGIVFGNLFGHAINQSLVSMIADVGVTLLLFTLGVEFSFHRLSRIMGKVLWAAIAQMVLCIGIFILLLILFGIHFLPAVFFAVAASLSSTAVIVRVLSEKGDLETVPGELLTGWLVVQDLSVVFLMVLLTSLAGLGTKGSVSTAFFVSLVAEVAAKTLIVFVLFIFVGRIVITKFINLMASVGSREIFLLTTVGIVFLSAIATAALGLPAALGAFIAGLLVAETSQNHAVFSEIRPLRDVFAVVFFVSIGFTIPIAFFVQNIGLILGLSSMVIMVKWSIVYILMRFLEHHKKPAFIVATGLVQISEFGFILAKLGMSRNIFNETWYLNIMCVTFVTICVGVPLFSRSEEGYYWFIKTFSRILPNVFGSKAEKMSEKEDYPMTDHIVICGYGRVGKYIGRALEMAGIPFLVVDYNHYTVARLKEKGIAVVYGDPADLGVLDYAQVDFSRAIVIAIPDRHTQEMIISNARTLNKKVRIICRTHHEEDQPRLKSLGVQTIVQPEFEAALSIISRLLGDSGFTDEEISGKVSRLKIEHGLG
jgi:monovalent cation:H+ antiporter-2, CPA2 family